MKTFRKDFTVHYNGRRYYVYFVSDGANIHAHCSCLACKYKTLCRHILQCVEDDAEIYDALKECGLWRLYEIYLQLEKSAGEIKRESKDLKKKFAQLLLE